MNIQKHFEVKTGKNKGYYIVSKIPRLENKWTFKALAKLWGMLVYDYNSGFYKYHHINPYTEVVWTHSSYGGDWLNKRTYKELLKKFGCSI